MSSGKSEISRRKFMKQVGVGTGAILGTQLLGPRFVSALGDNADLTKYKGTKLKVLGHPTHHVEGVIAFHDKFTELTVSKWKYNCSKNRSNGKNRCWIMPPDVENMMRPLFPLCSWLNT